MSPDTLSAPHTDSSTDFAWLNDDARTFLRRGYLLDDTGPTERVREIAEHAESILEIDGFADRFYEYMSRGYYSLASPVWANFGLDRGLPISCFGSYFEDTMTSILDTHAEVGMMTKVGGGTSGYFGDIRPRGAPITNNGTSNGTYPFAQLFDTVINVVSQGETRRGHFAGYIDIEHPDIEEWLNIQTEGDAIQTMMYGVVVGDDWMEAMIDGDTEKRDLWARVIEQRMNLGIPYILFRGNVQDGRPQVYKDQGYDVHASNLCLAGDQRVVTDRGYKTAEDLHEEGDALTLFDGEKAISASRMKLREEEADVYRITLDNGLEQKVTAYHGIPVYDGQGEYHREDAQNLEIGDRIVIQKNKGLFGNRHMPDEAFLLGLWQSDGTQHEDRKMIDVWESDFDIVEEVETPLDHVYETHGFDTYAVSNQHGTTTATRRREVPTFRDVQASHSNDAKKRLSTTALTKLGFEKGAVPEWIWESDEDTQWSYVRGLLVADGSVHMSESRGNPIQINYADVDRDFLQELQLLFNNLGLSSQIRLLQEGGSKMLPNGKGRNDEYRVQDCYRLIVGNKNAALEIEKYTGFLSRKGIELERRHYRDNTKKAYEVVEIEHVGTEPVYCPTTETDESVFVSQGVLTFNCSEIALPCGPDESFVCCLSSMNALHFDEWKHTNAVETLTYFLDAVMQEFIEGAEGMAHMDRAVRFAKRHRAIGIGILGWHSYLQSNMIPFESAEATTIGADIAKTIKDRSYAASAELADRFGEPPVLEGCGRRNATTMAVAPTKSSSFILGQVSPSIEPIKSNYHVQDRAKMKVTYKNPYLTALLDEKSKNTDEVWEQIALRDGSVQHLDILSEHEKEVFKTFSEISQMAIINQAAARQTHIDQSQSLNLAIDPNATPAKDVNRLYIEAWKTGIKSLYYQHGVNAAQAFSRDILGCKNCEG
ncbi:MAG: ribonucleoside-diphosphate reductase [Bacteroidetes bacterium SW_9_63_38]|nr:MAG: ribonucleoside-diphosphate reductase [Bacteroidetes bacterium SW_9_63_38]